MRSTLSLIYCDKTGNIVAISIYLSKIIDLIEKSAWISAHWKHLLLSGVLKDNVTTCCDYS